MVDTSLRKDNDDFFLVYAKFKCHILLQGISDVTNMVIYHVATIEKSEKKKLFNSVTRFAL